MTYTLDPFALRYTCETDAHINLIVRNKEDEEFRITLGISLEHAAKLAKRLAEEVKRGRKIEKESKGKELAIYRK